MSSHTLQTLLQQTLTSENEAYCGGSVMINAVATLNKYFSKQEINQAEYIDTLYQLNYHNVEKPNLPNFVNIKDDKDIVGDKLSVFVMVGLPCSGKSHLSKELGLQICSRDKVIMSYANGRTYNETYVAVDLDAVDRDYDAILQNAYNAEQSFIIDEINLSRDLQESRVAFANADKFQKVAVVKITDYELIHQRNDQRKDKIIPASEYARMLTEIQLPTLEQFDRIVFVNDSFICDISR